MVHPAVRNALRSGCFSCIAAVFLAGCAMQNAPQIDVVSATVVETTDEAHVVNVDLLMTNPGRRALALEEFQYRVHLDGVVYTGRRAAQATLSPHEAAREMRLSLPAVFGREAVPNIADRTLTVEGELEYVPPGQLTEMLLDLGFPRPKARFTGNPTLQ